MYARALCVCRRLPLIRSLCEVEFTLDEVAAELQRSMAAARIAARDAAMSASSGALEQRRDSINMEQMRGKLPSYVSLATYGDEAEEHGRAAYPVRDEQPNASPMGGRGRGKMPGVASHASLLNLASLDPTDDDPLPSTGMAPYSAS